MKTAFRVLAGLLLLAILMTGCQSLTPYGPHGHSSVETVEKGTGAPEVSGAEDPGVPLVVYREVENRRLETVRVYIEEYTAENVFGALVSQEALPGTVTMNSFSAVSETELALDLSSEFQTVLDGQDELGKTLLLASIVDTYLVAFGASSLQLTVNGKSPSVEKKVYLQPLNYLDASTDVSVPYELKNDTTPVDPTQGKYVALTFDDGPHSRFTKLIGKELEKYGAKATFFIVGDRLDEATIPAVQYVLDIGCEVGIHAWTHEYSYKDCDEATYRYELDTTRDAIKKYFGFTPIMMRPVGSGIAPERLAKLEYYCIQSLESTLQWMQ